MRTPRERQSTALGRALQSILRDVGLERRAKSAPDPTAYLAGRRKKTEPVQQAGGGGGDGEG